MLPYFIIGLMVLQLMLSATDFHLHSSPDQIHTYAHPTHTSHTVENQISDMTHNASDTYDHHHCCCCHSVSSSLLIIVNTTFLLPRPTEQIPLYKSDLYQTPVFDALIRPPISTT